MLEPLSTDDKRIIKLYPVSKKRVVFAFGLPFLYAISNNIIFINTKSLFY